MNDALHRLEDAGVIEIVEANGYTNARLFEARDVTGALEKFEAALITTPPISRDLV